MNPDDTYRPPADSAAEIAELRIQLAEAKETLEAIRTGAVDGLIVASPGGNRVFSLEGAETPYRALVEEINEGTLLLDPKGTILYANARFAQLVNTPPQQIGGSPCHRFFALADHSRLENLLQAARRIRLHEEFLLQPGAGAPPVPVQLSLSVLHGTQAQTFFAIATDLSERKQAEDTLRQANASLEARVRQRTAELTQANESLQREITEGQRLEAARARLAAIVETSKDAIISKDLDGRITSWNSAAEHLFGYRAEEIIGQSVTRLIPPECQPEESMIMRNLREGQSVILESTRVHKDGRCFPVSLSISPLRDALGAIIGGSQIARDISERKRMEQALTRSNEQLEESVQRRTAELQETVAELEHFSYTITHDMRAPLRAMRGLSGILLKECSECLHHTGVEYLRQISDSAERMDKLITDALQYSVVVCKHLNLEPVDSGTLLKGIIGSYPQFHPPHAKIQIDDPLPVVLGNKAALTQCFSNLLSNAVKFVHPGQIPEVRIWAETRQDPITVIRFWFEDRGIGIEKEYHEKVWQMFQQLNKSYEGTGIGLALVRKAAERMGGKVGLESQPGRGSRFWVELKAAESTRPNEPMMKL